MSRSGPVSRTFEVKVALMAGVSSPCGMGVAAARKLAGHGAAIFFTVVDDAE